MKFVPAIKYTCHCGNERYLKLPSKTNTCYKCKGGPKHFEWNGKKVSSPDLFKLGVFQSPRTAQVIWQTYGLSPTQFFKLIEKQGGICPISLETLVIAKRRYNIDHCHSTGKIRGILSPKANIALGNFSDNPKLLQKAWLYLKSGAILHSIDRSHTRSKKRRSVRSNSLWQNFRLTEDVF